MSYSMSRSSRGAAPGDVTELLRAWKQGSEEAFNEVLPLIYSELREIAARHLARERPDHTLQPTALVHEAYMKLVGEERVDWQNRSHFFAIAARTMRRILVEHARAHNAAKRGSGRPKQPLVESLGVSLERASQLVALDDSLFALAKSDPVKASIAELRFFGGLSLDDTALALGCSRATVIRQWRVAKAWLFHELSEERRA